MFKQTLQPIKTVVQILKNHDLHRAKVVANASLSDTSRKDRPKIEVKGFIRPKAHVYLVYTSRTRE